MLGQQIPRKGILGPVSATHAGQEVLRAAVEVDADKGHAVLDDGVESGGHPSTWDVQLVHSHAKMLRFHLHQLRQGVQEPPPDTHRACGGHTTAVKKGTGGLEG